MAECPECTAKVEVAVGLKAGEIVYCPDCSSELEIITEDPLALALAPEIEEDWGE
jgi:alpha-aminoadipate/glutamate carrier protein LysW